MSKASEFLNWWILNNVVNVPSDAKETAAWAHRLVTMCSSAAAKLDIDELDPALGYPRLYERMIDEISQAKANLDRGATRKETDQPHQARMRARADLVLRAYAANHA
jgi:hypothetical protein